MTMLRSMLFVPADSERKLAKAYAIGADALILDLEDAVAASRKDAARSMARAYLDDRPQRTAQLWVRINPLDHADVLADLCAVVGGRPDGIMLPKAAGPADIAQLGHWLDALEAREGVAAGSIGIMPVASETPAAALAMPSYADARLQRLVGLTWGAEDLSAAIGASTNRADDGGWDMTYRMVRSTCLLAAHAAGVQPIDTLHADFRDVAGLRTSSEQASRQGFTGRLAIHPDQVAVINAAFSPTAQDVAHARRVVAAFAADATLGTTSLDGHMLDRPHLAQAERVLARHAAAIA